MEKKEELKLLDRLRQAIEKDDSIENIIKFLNTESDRYLAEDCCRMTYSAEERQELREFYEYFMKHYGERTANVRLVKNGAFVGSEPYVIKCAKSLLEYDWEKADKELMQSVDPDIRKEAENLVDQMFSIKDDKYFILSTPNDLRDFYVYEGDIPGWKRLEEKNQMTVAFVRLIIDSGFVIGRIIRQPEYPDQVFGIKGTGTMWMPVSVETIKEETVGGNPSTEYIEIKKDGKKVEMKDIAKAKEVKTVEAVKAETKEVEVLAQNAKSAVEAVKDIAKAEKNPEDLAAQKLEKVAKAAEVPAQEIKTIEESSKEVAETPVKEELKEPTFVVEERQPTKPRKPRKKAEKPVDKVFVEFSGSQINIHDVVESAKEHYKALYEKENGPISTISVYVKPEEGVAYYAVNGIGGDNYKVGI